MALVNLLMVEDLEVVVEVATVMLNQEAMVAQDA
jgi:hypothetical protein